MKRRAARPFIAAGLCLTIQAATLSAQIASIEPLRPSAPFIIRPYLTPEVPPIRTNNSPRLADLIRAGTLYLTVQDAIALALENNIDIEVARYNPILAEWRLERAQAGGALPGVPSSAAQVGSVASGQGVVGSQQAAGVLGGGNNITTNQGVNATISQIGPVTQTLDPSIQQTTTFSHTTRPQPNLVQSLTPSLVSETRVYNTSIQQGFLTGGSVTASFRGNYLKENSPTDILNPSDASTLALTFQHSLLRGFGIAVNSRTITVSRMNVNISEIGFRSTVINAVAQVVNAYYALVGDDEDVAAKRSAAQVAETLLNNVKEQVRIGSLAPTEITRAESQVATTHLDLVNSQTARDQEELRLKSLISRNGTADRLLDAARIVPVDPIVVPDKDEFPPIDEMVKKALANRTDIVTTKSNLEASQVNALGTKNGLLPTLQVFGGESLAGLAGSPQLPQANPYFFGGMGTALGQSIRRNFPTDRIGAFYQASLKNGQAQADYAIDQLQLRQSDLSYRKATNQIEVDIRNSLIALRQARARVAAAVQNRKLAEESLRAEEKKYALGASTPTDVIQQQRDLRTARATEVAAYSTYQNARVSLEQTTGTVLEAHNVSIAEARQGVVPRKSVPPEPPVQK